MVPIDTVAADVHDDVPVDTQRASDVISPRQSRDGDVAKPPCHAVGPWAKKGGRMDKWCNRVCVYGPAFCPKQVCECDDRT